MFKTASLCTCLILVALQSAFPHSSTLNAQENDGESIALKRVELFPAGQGVFEYIATETKDADIVLPLQPNELDDLLKSLVLKGFDTVRVEFQQPDKPSEIATILKSDPTLTRAELLQELKGVSVTVQDGLVSKSGSIVSVELQSQIDQAIEQQTEVLTLHTAKGLEQIKLTQQVSVEFNDKETGTQFELANRPRTTAQSDRTPVTVKLKKKESGPASFAYQTQTAPWKCSYRIAKIDDKYQLVASAIVDNTSGQDWKDVELVLVIDQPLGFHSPLSTVQEAQRPSVPLAAAFSQAPALLAASKKQIAKPPQLAGLPTNNSDPFAPQERPFASGGMGGMGGGGMGGMMGGSFGGPPAQRNEPGIAAPTSDGVAYTAGGADNELSNRLGMSFTTDSLSREIFGQRVQIRIPNVSIASGASQNVFLPRIPHSIRPLSVFTTSTTNKHPFAAFEILLEDGYQLISGPGSVWNAEGYVGDVNFPRLISNVPQLVTYSLEPLIEVERVVQKETLLPTRWVVKSIESTKHLEEVFLTERIVRYDISNQSQDNKTLILEHRAHGDGWVPDLGTGQWIGTLHDLIRYETATEPNSKTKFEVRETRSGSSVWTVDSALETLNTLHRREDISADAKKLVASWIQVREKKLALEKTIRGMEVKIQSINDSVEANIRQQRRILELMKTLVRGDELHSRYLKRLSTIEDELEAANTEVAKIRTEIDGLKQ